MSKRIDIRNPLIILFIIVGSLYSPNSGLEVQAVSVGRAFDTPHPSQETEPKGLSGGATTVFNRARGAFSQPAANLPIEKLRDFTFGNRLFNTKWATAPASVQSFDGLGPLFNRNSCSGCHRKDGRGRPPLKSEAVMKSMLVRLSIPGSDVDGGPKPHPTYGGQLNNQSILGVPAEGRTEVTYEVHEGQFADGETYQLIAPTYRFTDLNYGTLGEEILFSPRVAPAVYGLGLLEAIPEETLLRLADPEDSDGDGISGRLNRVTDHIHNRVAAGRFGWKANQPSLKQQNAGAMLGDIGITTSVFPNENCTPSQASCTNRPNGGQPELRDTFLDKLTFYTQTLAVPARRRVDEPIVKQGERLFEQAGCASCHTPTIRTGEHPDVPQLSNQVIHPYTDLLLHDMGPGLADNRPDFLANGSEWRTPPLWGIGLVKVVNGHTRFLHDGRARGLMEAILWHGGEADTSREAVQQMSASDRTALIAFLESL